MIVVVFEKKNTSSRFHNHARPDAFKPRVEKITKKKNHKTHIIKTVHEDNFPAAVLRDHKTVEGNHVVPFVCFPSLGRLTWKNASYRKSTSSFPVH